MSRIYSAPFTGTVTAAGGDVDLWSIQPAANKSINLRGFTLGQISEVGDLQEEGVRITVRRMHATFTVGSGGSVVTALATPGSSVDTVWGATVRANDTTVSTATTNQICDEFGWNLRNSPYEHWYPDERFCPGCFNTQALVIRMETTLADDMTFTGVVWFQEEG